MTVFLLKKNVYIPLILGIVTPLMFKHSLGIIYGSTLEEVKNIKTQ